MSSKKDLLSTLMDKQIDKFVPEKSKTRKSSAVKETKVAEQYFSYLKKHQDELKKEKVSVMLQVGSFFEIYGYITPTGEKIGNVWQVAGEAELAIAAKAMTVFDDVNNQLYMAGVKEEYVNKYIDKLVDQHGWTLAIYEQIKEKGGHTRRLKNIISPGINFENENVSNVLMYIYIKSYKNRLSTNNEQSINYGIYYVDCISGMTGAMELYSSNSKNISVELSEIMKLLSIQNPKEVVIHLDLADNNITQLRKRDLYTSLSLYNRNAKFIEEPIDSKYEKSVFQRHLLETVYPAYKSNTDIFIQLHLTDRDFARIAICLGIRYIKQHNSEIINNLTHLEIGHNKQDYLMLANNCLYQLDILNSDTKFRGSSNNSNINVLGDNMISMRKITLLDILNNTKTVMGSRLIRSRLSMPITDITELNSRYNEIEKWINLQLNYLSKERDTNIHLSPLNKIRNVLNDIHDIPKYLRKMATGYLKPNELNTILNSCTNTVKLYELITDFNLLKETGDLIDIKKEFQNFQNMIDELNTTFNMDECNLFWCNIENNIFTKGFDSTADELQNNILLNKDILSLVIEAINKYLEKQNITEKVRNKFRMEIKTVAKLGGKHIYINNDLYNYLKEVSKEETITVNGKKIKFSELEFYFHKKGHYMVKCNMINFAAQSLTNDIDKLVDYIKELFNTWQIEFYNKYKFLFNLICQFISESDLNQCNAYNALKYNYNKPNICLSSNDESSYFKAAKIRHPLVEIINPSGYISNNISLGGEAVDNGILLYGPNAAGKSTLSKAIGINIIMAQAGFYVPSTSFEYYPYNYIFTRIKNNDNLHAGLSSFQVEMRELKVILDYCGDNSIVLGDEILNSTNSLDATAIMSSALITLHNRGCHFMFATHLHFLTQLEKVVNLSKLGLYHMGIKQNPENPTEIIYERKMRTGSGPRSYAILISQNMNMDEEFINMAFDIRRDIEEGKSLSISGTLEGEAELVQWDNTKYNNDKIVDKCQICSNPAVDVHHINEQNTATLTGFINTEDDCFHKNRLNNLVSLCKKCHQAVHASPPTLNISGYVESTSGWKLNYNWIDDTPPPSYNETITIDNEKSKVLTELKDNDLKNDKTDVDSFIRELKNAGKTIKQIQYQLRTKLNTKMKLVEIETLAK